MLLTESRHRFEDFGRRRGALRLIDEVRGEGQQRLGQLMSERYK